MLFFYLLAFIYPRTVWWKHNSRHFGLDGCTFVFMLVDQPPEQSLSATAFGAHTGMLTDLMLYINATFTDTTLQIFAWHWHEQLCFCLCLWGLFGACCIYIVCRLNYTGVTYICWDIVDAAINMYISRKMTGTKPSPPDAGWAEIPERFQFSFQCCVSQHFCLTRVQMRF